MEYYTSIVFLIFLTLILMLGIIYTNKNMKREKRKVFALIYILILIATLCEFAGVLLDGTTGSLIFLHKIIKFLEFSITPVFIIIFARTIFSLKKDGTIIPYIFLIFHTILEFLSIFYNFIFSVDDSGYYHHECLYSVYIVTFIISAIYFFKKLFDFSKYYQNKNMYNLISIVFFVIVGISIQFIVPAIKTTWLTISISSIFIYIYYNEITMYVDHLTKLLNQRSYKNYLENISFPVDIILFDIDNFKNINDSFGHDFGDIVISTIGKTIKKIYGCYGYCFRIGGDEFCVIFLTNKYPNDFVKILNDIFVEEIEKQHRIDSRLPLVSIGSSHFEPGHQDISDVVKSADKQMYSKKNAKKN